MKREERERKIVTMNKFKMCMEMSVVWCCVWNCVLYAEFISLFTYIFFVESFFHMSLGSFASLSPFWSIVCSLSAQCAQAIVAFSLKYSFLITIVHSFHSPCIHFYLIYLTSWVLICDLLFDPKRIHSMWLKRWNRKSNVRSTLGNWVNWMKLSAHCMRVMKDRVRTSLSLCLSRYLYHSISVPHEIVSNAIY